jgi:hypothetical protein
MAVFNQSTPERQTASSIKKRVATIALCNIEKLTVISKRTPKIDWMKLS